MQRFLIALLLICTNVISTFGQTDTIPQWQDLHEAEMERLETLPQDLYGSLTLGAEISHTHLQDRLISPLLYSGFSIAAELEAEGVVEEQTHLSFLMNIRLGKFNAPLIADIPTGDNRSIALYQSGVEVRLAAERRWASSPHFVGGFLSLYIGERHRIPIPPKNQPGRIRVDDVQAIIGLSYLYRTQISKIPVRAHFTLPSLIISDRTNHRIGYNPSRYFAPTLRTEVLIPVQKDGIIRLFYTWHFRLIKDAPKSVFNYRHNINSIGIAIGVNG